ncbi:MAG: hypothetical protein V2A79_11955 [Planctomycetota bacterium]
MNTTETKPAPLPPRMELAIPVSDRVQIQDVRLVRCNCHIEPGALAPPHPPRFKANFAYEASTQVGPDRTRIAVVTRFQFSAIREESEKHEPCVGIEASFLVTYAADGLTGLGPEHFSSFGALNGVFNAWPYWRELLHNLTFRMGLPAFVLPVLRIGSPKPASPNGGHAPGDVAEKVDADKQPS